MSRNPALDATANLGQIHTQTHQLDAVHVAVFQGTISEDGNHSYELQAGSHVKLDLNGYLIPASGKSDSIGIIDPFIVDQYETPFDSFQGGEKVYVLLWPGAITSLRHVWSLPGFPDLPVETSVQEHIQSLKLEEDSKVLECIKTTVNNTTTDVEEAFKRVSEFAETIGLSYKKLMEHASIKTTDDDHYYVGDAECEGMSIYSKFWEDYNLLTASKYNPDKWGGNFISCSC